MSQPFQAVHGERTGPRCPRRALVVLAGNGAHDEREARRLIGSLADLGIEARYLGRETNARDIASAAAEQGADAIEVCLTGGGGVILLRDLLRELIAIGRRDVSIVVHRATLHPSIPHLV
jgi:methylmalonyl-CoA mutase cobalamin-binding domain/chain